MARTSEDEHRGWRLGNWSTKDLLVFAAIGVALGLALVPVNYAWVALQTAIGPFARALFAGLNYLPILLALYITRRPGAGLLCSLFLGLVQAALTPFGWVAIIAFLTPGIGCELPFLLTRYRRFGLVILTVAGALGWAVRTGRPLRAVRIP